MDYELEFYYNPLSGSAEMVNLDFLCGIFGFGKIGQALQAVNSFVDENSEEQGEKRVLVHSESLMEGSLEIYVVIK